METQNPSELNEWGDPVQLDKPKRSARYYRDGLRVVLDGWLILATGIMAAILVSTEGPPPMLIEYSKAYIWSALLVGFGWVSVKLQVMADER